MNKFTELNQQNNVIGGNALSNQLKNDFTIM